MSRHLCIVSLIQCQHNTFTTFFSGTLAVFATALTTIGVYGVVTYSISRHTHEIGIHMALEARMHDVLITVMRNGLKPVLIGVVVGLAGAFALTRVISSLFYEVGHNNPLTLL